MQRAQRESQAETFNRVHNQIRRKRQQSTASSANQRRSYKPLRDTKQPQSVVKQILQVALAGFKKLKKLANLSSFSQVREQIVFEQLQ